MTVAGKIYALVTLIAAIGGTLLTTSITYFQYTSQRDTLLQQTFENVAANDLLQVAVFHNDQAQQQAFLQDQLDSSAAVRYALILDPAGTPVVVKQQAGMPAYPEQLFDSIRGGASVADESLTFHSSNDAPDDQGMLTLLMGGDKIWDLTIPVLSVISPLQKNISRSDFANALTSVEEAKSRYVIGYAHVGISRSGVMLQTLPTLYLALGLALGFIALSVIFGRYMTRRITLPFSTLVKMADDIAAGRAVESRGLEPSGEFKDIVALLNTIIGGLNTYKTKMDVDHQLLSMKVEERTSQLSKRNEELNTAVEEATKTKDRMRQLAYYDSLTSLPNRRLFTEQLDLLIKLSKRNKQMVALLFLDLDNFKRINDSLGHSAGDILLREVAKRLAHCVRDSDVVAHYLKPDSEIDVSRLGGDEFTIVLNQLDEPESAGVVAQRVLDSLARPVNIDGHELVVTPSIGIAVAPVDADDVESLLKAADTAMYNAKSLGKNSFVYYSSDMDATGVERLTLENDLRKAIERDELVLHYQPQVDTLTGTVIGAEALMRWQHPEHGLVPPFKFIPLAEELGLIGALGQWGLEEACRQTVELQSMGLDLPKIAVNVSALQFDGAFIKRVSEVLTKTGLRPVRLELELTEGIMLDGTDATLRAFSDLKALGVQLSLDDFGTGYSSLSYLSRFPLDELKIDRSFVIDFDKSQADASLIIAIISMAKSMRLNLVAEGVETLEQYRFLRQSGASVIQGYLFSKPVPAKELKELLQPGYFHKQIAELNGT
ncbi:MAG: diguanylate cyclase (GGDEF)-like protein [Halioglobus sp.]